MKPLWLSSGAAVYASSIVAVIDKDEGSAYGVRFPDVPGYFSAADTFDEIVPNSGEALSLFFEDGGIVPARGIEAVRK